MTKRPPRYPKRPHSSGLARITLDGKTFYLGRFGSRESYARYQEVIHKRFSTEANVSVPDAKLPAPITVAKLFAQHGLWAEQRYVKNGLPTGEANNFRLSLRPALAAYADLDVDQFGPLCLLNCRTELARSGLCGDEVNKRMRRIRRVFRWGVSRELVRPETFTALSTVEGLRKGEQVDGIIVPQSLPIGPVPLEKVRALQGHVLPQVWAMIQLQLWTAMRPGEVCLMRTCDIQRESAVVPKGLRDLCWVYTPESHKTEHHGRRRIILLPPPAQKILQCWLRPEVPEAFLFSPAEAVRFQSVQRAIGAPWAGKNKKRAADPQRRPGNRYTTMTYARAIHRGCESAFRMPSHLRRVGDCKARKDGYSSRKRRRLLKAAAAWRAVNCWQANQLRHTAATLIREQFGVEVARVILGHSQLSTTEIYAERDYAAAARALAGWSRAEASPTQQAMSGIPSDQPLTGTVLFLRQDGRLDTEKMEEMRRWGGRVCIQLASSETVST